MDFFSQALSKTLGFLKKRGYIVAVCALTALLATESIFIVRNAAQQNAQAPVTAQVGDITDWGLSFGKAGEMPRGNASADYLKQFDAYFVGDTSQKTLYLTFDAGYENGHTEQILDVLKAADVKACFFLVEHYINSAPELVQRMVDEGHMVANHTASHPDMSKITSVDAFARELSGVEKAFNGVTGAQLARYYRPPQGKYCEANLKQAQELGYKTVFWSLAHVDWDENNQPEETAALEKLVSRSHQGAVILLHSTSKTNANILNRYIGAMREQGYTFMTLDDLP